MKKAAIFILLISLFISCDPDVPGEEINLPQMEFGIKIYPDSAYIKLGDTVTIYTSISSTLSNGIKITNGKASINWAQGYHPASPIINADLGQVCIEGSEYDIVVYDGDVNLNSSGLLLDVYAIPIGDSIKFMMKYIPLKTGTYSLSVFSKFFESSEGKTRTQPYFDMENRHWDLWQDSKYPIPNPDEYGYKTRYLFAVYE